MCNDIAFYEQFNLPEQQWNEMHWSLEDFAVIEPFCARTQIPIKVIEQDEESIRFLLRDGMDTNDTYSYFYWKTLTLEEVIADSEIFFLRQMRFLFSPTYAYEYCLYRTEKDKEMLDFYAYPKESESE